MILAKFLRTLPFSTPSTHTYIGAIFCARITPIRYQTHNPTRVSQTQHIQQTMPSTSGGFRIRHIQADVLQKYTGCEDLSRAVMLDLSTLPRDDKVKVLDMMDLVPNLVELKAPNNALTSLASLPSKLHTVNVRGNMVERLDTLPPLPALTTLDVSHNNIDSVPKKLVKSAPLLRDLDVSHNCIKNLSQVQPLRHLHLETLNMTGNDVCNVAHYRSYIIWASPTIRVLDGVEVTPEERHTANERWQNDEVIRRDSNILELQTKLQEEEDKKRSIETKMGSEIKLTREQIENLKVEFAKIKKREADQRNLSDKRGVEIDHLLTELVLVKSVLGELILELEGMELDHLITDATKVMVVKPSDLLRQVTEAGHEAVVASELTHKVIKLEETISRKHRAAFEATPTPRRPSCSGNTQTQSTSTGEDYLPPPEAPTPPEDNVHMTLKHVSDDLETERMRNVSLEKQVEGLQQKLEAYVSHGNKASAESWMEEVVPLQRDGRIKDLSFQELSALQSQDDHAVEPNNERILAENAALRQEKESLLGEMAVMGESTDVEVSAVQSELSQVLEQHQHTLARHAELEVEIVNERRMVRDLQAQITQERQNNSVLREDLRSTQEERDVAEDMLNKYERGHDNNNPNNNNDDDDITQRLDRALHDLDAAHDQIASLEDALDGAHAHNDRPDGGAGGGGAASKDLQARLIESHQDAAVLRRDLAERDGALQRMHRELDDVRAEGTAAVHDLEEMEAEVERMQAEKSEVQNECSVLRQENAHLRSEPTQTRAHTEALQVELAQVKEQNRIVASRHARELEDVVAADRSNIKDLQAQLRQEKTAHIETRQILIHAEEEQAEQRAASARHEEEHNGRQVAHSEASARLARTTLELEAARERIDDLQTELDTLRQAQSVDRYHETSEARDRKLQETTALLTTERRETEHLRNELDMKKVELNLANQQVDQLAERCEELDNDATRMIEERINILADDIDVKPDALLQENRRLEDALKEKTRACTALQHEVSVLAQGDSLDITDTPLDLTRNLGPMPQSTMSHQISTMSSMPHESTLRNNEAHKMTVRILQGNIATLTEEVRVLKEQLRESKRRARNSVTPEGDPKHAVSVSRRLEWTQAESESRQRAEAEVDRLNDLVSGYEVDIAALKGELQYKTLLAAKVGELTTTVATLRAANSDLLGDKEMLEQRVARLSSEILALSTQRELSQQKTKHLESDAVLRARESETHKDYLESDLRNLEKKCRMLEDQLAEQSDRQLSEKLERIRSDGEGIAVHKAEKVCTILLKICASFFRMQ